MAKSHESGVTEVAGPVESGWRSALASWSTDEPRVVQRRGAGAVRGEPLDGSPLGIVEWAQRTVAELRVRAEVAEAVLDNLITGVFTLAAEGQVLHANRKGEQILSARDGLRLSRNRLRCVNPCDTKRLDSAVERAGDVRQQGGRSSILAIRRPSLRRPFGAVVAPMRARNNDQALRLVRTAPRSGGVLVSVSDPEDIAHPSVEGLTSLFGLTPAEARLAAALAGRQTVSEYAEEAGISRGTARWTLKRVLEKTQCRRQTELALLLAASAAALLWV
jgi:DNA-binding CsgD family transcriptional regulator/PAS domain-containing protein